MYRKGFTLVELLVVIAIIGILASVVLVSLNSARAKARDARRISDLKQITLALENYYDDNGAYPPSYRHLDPVYISVDLSDPQTGAEYWYRSAACPVAFQSYLISAQLEDSSHRALDGDLDGIVCTYNCEDVPNNNYCVAN